jgi:non-haem Fe2+, alpha-ketoglutarate-dependent halogenase
LISGEPNQPLDVSPISREYGPNEVKILAKKELLMTSGRLINKLKSDGFVNAGQLALSAKEFAELWRLADEVCDNLAPDHPLYLSPKGGVGGVGCLPQLHPEIAKLIDKVVSNAEVRSILQSVLGLNYKIAQINLRRSYPGDEGLSLHQDAPGQVNLWIFLSGNSSGDGTTSFLPGSNHIFERARNLRLEVPAALFALLRFLIVPFTGRLGDIGFYFNRTWHGRFANRSNNIEDVIGVSFFPEGASMDLGPPYDKWSTDFVQSIRGTELGRLLDRSDGLAQQSDGRHQVIPAGNKFNNELAYSLAIETEQGPPDALVTSKLKRSICILRVVMGAGRPFFLLFRLYRKIMRILR